MYYFIILVVRSQVEEINSEMQKHMEGGLDYKADERR
jgi:hypothetical protein